MMTTTTLFPFYCVFHLHPSNHEISVLCPGGGIRGVCKEGTRSPVFGQTPVGNYNFRRILRARPTLDLFLCPLPLCYAFPSLSLSLCLIERNIELLKEEEEAPFCKLLLYLLACAGLYIPHKKRYHLKFFLLFIDPYSKFKIFCFLLVFRFLL